MTKTSALDRFETTVRAICLAYPEAYEDHPWGESAFKVKGKVFVFMGHGDDHFGISTKLPISNAVALMLPFAEPTHYGLGKSGWVSARFGAKDEIPLDLLTAWIDESYRAVAPKKLVAALPPIANAGSGQASPPPAPGAKTKAKSPAKPRAAAKPKAAAPKPRAAVPKPRATAPKPAASKQKAAASKPAAKRRPAT